MKPTSLLLLLFMFFAVSSASLLWPSPSEISFGSDTILIDPENLKTTIPANYIVNKAFERYEDLFFPFRDIRDPTHDISLDTLTEIMIAVTSTDQTLDIGTDESYEVTITSAKNGKYIAAITAATCFGAIRGLETFSQLIEVVPDLQGNGFTYQIQNVPIRISDSPRFKWRGLLVDTSRHYATLGELESILDAMAFTKLNVFHWHITDSQSFPFESETFPELVKGAFRPEAIYSHEDIRYIVQYAYLRGITVIPEIDTPGHIKSWGVGYPEVVIPCMVGTGEDAVDTGILDPANELTYDIIEGLYSEEISLFPSYIHIGADEVKTHCWTDNSTYVDKVADFWSQPDIDISPYDTNAISSYFFSRTIPILSQHMRGAVAWEEFHISGVSVAYPDIIIQAWRGWPNGGNGFRSAIDAGYRALLSTHWYLDEYVHSERTWYHFYTVNNDRLHFASDHSELALGGEACLWGELVLPKQRELFIWPNAASIAERLWSEEESEFDNAEERLNAWICRVQRRGIRTSEIRPGFCYGAKEESETKSYFDNIVDDLFSYHSKSSLVSINTFLVISFMVLGIVIGFIIKFSIDRRRRTIIT